MSRLLSLLTAAGAAALLSLGADTPAKLRVAPGEIVLLTAPGIRMEAARATTLPLPTTLSAFSLVLKQSLIEIQTAVPLFAVLPVRQCDDAAVCRDAVEIQAQIPFELIPNIPESFRPENFASLVVLDGTRTALEITLDPVPDNVRILTSCGLRPAKESETCEPLVTHAGGEMVSGAKPAVGGEPLVVYATGLGATDPKTASGAAITGLVKSVPLRLRYQFGANADPPAGAAAPSEPATEFSGLTPGFVGLYQVQFPAPLRPPETPGCGGDVKSNLAIRLAGQTSSGAAAICVQ